MKIETLEGDCLDVMRTYADDTFDLTFTSPPYEAQRTYGIGFSLQGQEYVDWAVERFRECLRVTRGLVAWVVEGKTRQFRYSATPALIMADLHRAGVHLRKPPVFHRVGIPGSGGPDWLRNDWEWIICATSGGKLPWSDNTAMGQPCKYRVGGAMSHRTTSGGRVEHDQGYQPPKKANPGNVIHCSVSQLDIVMEILGYAYATQTRPGEVLRSLQKATSSEEVFQWGIGIIAGFTSAKILRPDLYGHWRTHVGVEALRELRKFIPAPELHGEVLLSPMLFGSVGPTARIGASGGYRESESKETHRKETVRSMRGDERSSSSSSRRKPDKQRGEQSTSPVPGVPFNSTQPREEARAIMPHLWENSGEELQRLWDAVRQALPAIQKAWRSVTYCGGIAPLSEGGFGSNVIHCPVGGGRMGNRLCHENEAPFPEALAEFFIRSFCPPGGSVLDPFCGSGTTLDVARQHGRHSVGIDIRASQIELSQARLAS